jgi:hypothetical protein
MHETRERLRHRSEHDSADDAARIRLPLAGEAELWTRRLLGVADFVRTGSEVCVDEGDCCPTRARARCACKSSRIRPAASTPATPAIAAKEGSRRGRSRRRTAVVMEMRTFGELRERRPSRPRDLLWQQRISGPPSVDASCRPVYYRSAPGGSVASGASTLLR